MSMVKLFEIHEHAPLPRDGIWNSGDYSIIVLTKNADPARRGIADNLAQESEGYAHCYFVPQDPHDPHTFLALFKDDPIGFLQMDMRHHDYSVSLRLAPQGRRMWERASDELIWSAVCVWVKPQFRRQGIGKQLCMAACAFFQTTPREIGWATPVSESGRALLTALNVDPVKLT